MNDLNDWLERRARRALEEATHSSDPELVLRIAMLEAYARGVEYMAQRIRQDMLNTMRDCNGKRAD